MKMILLALLSFGVYASTTNTNVGEIIGLKKNCNHVIIRKNKSNVYYVGKITEGDLPHIGDLVDGDYETGQHILNNTKSLQKFEFFTKSLVNGKVKANEKLKEFCQ